MKFKKKRLKPQGVLLNIYHRLLIGCRFLYYPKIGDITMYTFYQPQISVMQEESDIQSYIDEEHEHKEQEERDYYKQMEEDYYKSIEDNYYKYLEQ